MSHELAVGPQLLLGARLVSTLALVGLAWWRLDVTAVLDALASVKPLPALAGWTALLAGQLISGARWRAVAARQGLHAPRGWFVAAYLRGCFYNTVLPTGIGGDATRVLLARRLTTTAIATRTVLVDRGAGFAALLLSAMALLPFTGYASGASAGVAIALGLAGLVVGLATAGLVARRGWFDWLRWTLAFEVVWFAGVWLLAQSVGIPLSPLAVPLVVLIVGVAIALPISIGGTGAREVAFVLALAPLGVSATAAVALGIAFGLALALVGICGVLVPLSSPRLAGAETS